MPDSPRQARHANPAPSQGSLPRHWKQSPASIVQLANRRPPQERKLRIFPPAPMSVLALPPPPPTPSSRGRRQCQRSHAPSTQAASPASPQDRPARRWVAPGHAGLANRRHLFHAQVLMSAHGFSPGVIDGKEGEVVQAGVAQLPGSRAGWTGPAELDARDPPRAAKANRPSTVMVTPRLGRCAQPIMSIPFPYEPGETGRASSSSVIATCWRRSPSGITLLRRRSSR